jgi:anti-sigma factor RsiW
MNSDDIELLTYVDGALSTHERDTVERRLARSPDAALRVRRLEASRLPYAEAFAQQRLPPVPASLQRTVGGIAQTARRDASIAARIERRAGVNDADAGPPPAAATRNTVASGWLAAAFFAGALACGFALHFDRDYARPTTAVTAMSTASWIEAAARYQQLYSRDTLANIDTDRASSQDTVARIHREDGLAVSIPDLSAYGLTFKRVQRLRFDGRPLVQIVYLPERGDPIALCVMQDRQPDATPTHHAIASMAVVAWRRAEVGYALIGSSGKAGLDTLARHIADGDTAPLFGSVGMPDEIRLGSREVLASSD